jgi:group I intron endonuclease
MANINQNKKYHYIYKTTNLLTGRYYVGMHSTSNLSDGYLGSGKRLRRAIRKHGKENFQVDILEFHESRDKLVEREKALINEDLIKDPMCMNLKLGGSGGLHLMTPEEAKVWHSLGGKKSGQLRREDLIKQNVIRNQKLKAEGFYQSGKFKYDWSGKKHKPESIEKMKLVVRNGGIGPSNSQYGTCWITDGLNNKKIKKGDCVPEGWYLGRVCG